MRFSEVKAFISSVLPERTLIHPGPDDPEVPTHFVLVTPSGGAGLTVEDLFDARGFQIKSVGRQNDYDSAESMAWDIDALIIGVDSSRMIGSTYVLSFTRSGGPPEPLYTDDANRTHFVCSYTATVQSSVA